MKVHKITCEKHGKIAVYCEECLAEKMKECEEDLKEIIKLNQKIIHERDKEIWKLKKEREKETFNEKQSKTVAKLLDEQEKFVREECKNKFKRKVEELPTVADAECLEDLKDWKDSDLIRKSEVLKIIKKAGKE